MNLLYFIRLLFKNLALLIILPFVFVAIVFFLTKDEAKSYISNASVYTGIATGSSIVSLEESKLDLFGSRTAFDNLINIIKSRSTIEEVAIRLFTSHMILDKYSNEIIQRQSYNDLMEIVPDDLKHLVVKGDFETTLARFKKYKNKDHTNFLYELINYNHKYYSSKKILSNVKVNRVQSSDLVQIVFKAEDPGICQQTLNILIEVFIREYSNIKVNQSDAVVKYFLGQLDVANARLNVAENELLSFNKSNSIINYYEQTKHIASEKEHFDLTYQDIKMQNAAAASVLKVLESKMSSRVKTKVNSSAIIDLRNQLAKVNLAIAMKLNEQQLGEDGEDTLVDNLSVLQNQSYQLKEMLKDAINEQYDIDNTAEGLPSESILEDWLDKVIEFEATKAQLDIGNEKHREFKELFKNYAPLGATMKRLERKIDVAEREYLALLQSLNLAKLKQQNIELNSNLKIVAAPFFPISAEPSKRKFLLVIAFMIGFVIPAFSIIVLEFLDQNIKNTFRAQNLTGLSVAAIFPILNNNKQLDFDFVKKRGLDVIARRLILNTESVDQKPKPDVNLFFSVLDGEGKTLLLTSLLEKLSDFGYRILLLKPTGENEDDKFKTLIYNVNNSFHRVSSVSDLDVDWTGVVLNDYDYLFIEIPGILNNSYPIKLFKSAHHSFLVTRANRAWSKSDQNSLKDILEYTGENQPQILLNGVALEEMETVLGDLPKKRSFIRRIVKNIVRLQFFSKQKLGTKDYNEDKTKYKNYKPWLIVTIILISIISILFIVKVYFYPKFKEADTKQIYEPIEVETYNDQGLEAEINIETPKLIEDQVVISKPEDNKGSAQAHEFTLKYYVVGGTFRSKENALKSVKKYKELGYNSQIYDDSGNIYKVAVGVYDSKIEAEKVRDLFLKYIPNSDVWILISTD